MSSSHKDKVYFEPQEAAFCGVHCVNNLLQNSYFDVVGFSTIAHELDEQERKIMVQGGESSADFLKWMANDSSNVDEQGNFSVEVIKRALSSMKLTSVSI